MGKLKFSGMIAVLWIAFLGFGARAQTAPVLEGHDDVQSWNDVQLTAPLGKPVDVFMKVTMRFGKNITRLNDGRYAFGIVWKPTKALSVSPYYWYVRARNATGDFRTENRLAVAATYKFPIKKFGLSHRSTYEYRMRAVNSWRYRAMITVEKELPEKFMKHTKWFVADEIFYDSLVNRFVRNRFGFGISRAINKHLTWDLYYTRQNDGISRPGDLHIIWNAWKFRL